MARPVTEKQCFLLIRQDASSLPKESDFQKQLESKDDNQKIEALKKIILHLLNGESLPKLLMPVIKYTLHSENHTVKKLLLLYLEIVEKKDSSTGHLLHEMILVCNHLKNNLNHPNEYVRGCTLRFLCRLKEQEILESLIPSIISNLTHRHSYVRKNAVMCIYQIYQTFPDLMVDAPEAVEKMLAEEQNQVVKRNAFLFFFHCDQGRAIKYLNSIMDSIGTVGDTMQLAVLALIRKVCRQNPNLKGSYLRCIHTLVNLPHHAVAFEAANTLVSLYNVPVAARAAIQAYTQLLQEESDNNVKLIILDRLSMLKKQNGQILSEMLMDILRALASPNLDIRKKTLSLAMELVSPRNVESVIALLKKELQRTEAPQQESNPEEYRKLLVDTMHKCSLKYPDVVSSVVFLLLPYLSDSTEGMSSAVDVVHFVRESVEEHPKLRVQILTKLMQTFEDIRSPQVYRVALWILGEYSEDTMVDPVLLTIRTAVGALPLYNEKDEIEEGKSAPPDEKTKKEEKRATGPVVLSDGTYASQSRTDTKPTVTESLSSTTTLSDGKLEVKSGGLRTLLLAGEWFLASQLAVTFTKLLLRYTQLNGAGSPLVNEERAKALYLFVCLLRLGESGRQNTKPITPDAKQRISLCFTILADPKTTALPVGADVPHSPIEKERKIEQESEEKAGEISRMFLAHSKSTLAKMLEHTKKETATQKSTTPTEPVKQVDDLIVIRQLRGKNYEPGAEDSLEDDDADISKAVGIVAPPDPVSRLQRIYQLTGYGDPVYAEAKLNVMEYDIVLDILIINQTQKILQNLNVELHTSGDLKVVDRPQATTMPPKAQVHVIANIKVTSTDSGIIFGNIVYDSASGTEKTVVVLNNIHMDIIDFIGPATCTELRFRHMWAEFEWENKVAVNTDITDLNEYLQHVVKITNMSVMTIKPVLEGESMFLAANLYARSMFGEDAVLNLSVEKSTLTGKDKITGYIRIRSKTQGIALSLGDKITSSQKAK